MKTISLAITFYGCDAESIVDFHLKVKKGKKTVRNTCIETRKNLPLGWTWVHNLL